MIDKANQTLTTVHREAIACRLTRPRVVSLCVMQSTLGLRGYQ